MRLWVEPSVIDAIAVLPGNVRQRVRRAIRDLPDDPHNSDDLRELLSSR